MRLYFGDDYKRSKPQTRVYKLDDYSYYYDRSKRSWVVVKDGFEPLYFKTRSEAFEYMFAN